MRWHTAQRHLSLESSSRSGCWTPPLSFVGGVAHHRRPYHNNEDPLHYRMGDAHDGCAMEKKKEADEEQQ